MYIGAPFHFMFMQRWPNHRRNSCFVGIALMALGLITSSFSQAVWQLILTQGVLYAIGGMLIYYPVMLFLDEWFVQRKGMAFGIMWVSISHIPRNSLGTYGYDRLEAEQVESSYPLPYP